MVIPHWILFLTFLYSENCLGQHIRHERTRYMSGRNQLYASGYNPNEDEANENELPIVHFWKRPLQTLENSMITPKKWISRPLFSWDLPEPTTVHASSKESSTTSTSPSFVRSLNVHTNDVTYGPKATSQRESKPVKDFTAYRSSYRFLTPSKKKNKKSIEVKVKSKKREEQYVKWETTTNETRRRKLRRKNGRRRQGSTTLRPVSETKTGLITDEYHQPVTRAFASTPSTKPATINDPLSTPTAGDSPCDLVEPKCEHLCQNVNGTAKCVCFRGFAPSGNKCIDINECEVNNGDCNGKCINTIGSRKCVCSSGYRLQDVCTDINECLLRNGHGPCQDRCINTPGSYRCTCEGIPGTRLSSDGHTCKPSDGCDPQVHGCSHSCVNFSRRAYCVCPDGLELSEDWKTCRDINECFFPEDYNVKCQSRCINTVGSYYCSTANETISSSTESNTVNLLE